MTIFHVGAIVLTVLFVLYADEQGIQWMLGKKKTLDKRRIEILHAIVGVGISLIILAGGLIAIPRLDYLLTNTTFLIKMGFVGVLIINAFFIDTLSRIASEKPFRELTQKERVPVLLSGALSVAGWVGAIMCGILLS